VVILEAASGNAEKSVSSHCKVKVDPVDAPINKLASTGFNKNLSSRLRHAQKKKASVEAFFMR